MKKLLLLFTLIPCIAFGQTTLIPDANFEQALIDLGYDNIIDGSVLTANISGVDSLYVWGLSISDLTGIEDFTALTDLNCGYNLLMSLDVSNNPALTYLDCEYNQLTSLDISNNTALTLFRCSSNQLTSLDVSNNTALFHLDCSSNLLTGLDLSNNTSLNWFACVINQLTSLDVSNNTALESFQCQFNNLTSLDVSNNTALNALHCWNNQLTCLNMKNGNTDNLIAFNNPNLTCIEVDDSAYSATNWTSIDPQTSFSEDCNYPAGCWIVGIEEELPTKDKELRYITDILGRSTQPVPNSVLFYIYDDGSVEKTIFLDD